MNPASPGEDAASHGPPTAPNQVVGRAIQDLTAARLGRGFLPHAGLAAVGGVGFLFLGHGAAGVALLLGAPAAAAAMLAYGLRGVQRAFGRAHRPWMSAAVFASVVPPGVAIYAFAWHGLRSFAGSGPGGWAYGAVTTLLGAWALRAWLRVIEVQRLAETMTDLTPPTGGWSA